MLKKSLALLVVALSLFCVCTNANAAKRKKRTRRVTPPVQAAIVSPLPVLAPVTSPIPVSPPQPAPSVAPAPVVKVETAAPNKESVAVLPEKTLPALSPWGIQLGVGLSTESFLLGKAGYLGYGYGFVGSLGTSYFFDKKDFREFISIDLRAEIKSVIYKPGTEPTSFTQAKAALGTTLRSPILFSFGEKPNGLRLLINAQIFYEYAHFGHEKPNLVYENFNHYFGGQAALGAEVKITPHWWISLTGGLGYSFPLDAPQEITKIEHAIITPHIEALGSIGLTYRIPTHKK